MKKTFNLKATDKEHDRVQDEAERLVRKSPTKKPPRLDKERRKIEVNDPDLNQKDPDMSLNYKVIGGSVALRYLSAFDYDVDYSTPEEEDLEDLEVDNGELDDEDGYLEDVEESDGDEGEDEEAPIAPPTREPSDATIMSEARRL